MTWNLYVGDCLGPGGMPSLGDKSVASVICDPPYSERTHTRIRRSATNYRERKQDGASARRVVDLGFGHITPEQMMQAAEQWGRIARRWVVAFCELEMAAEWQRAYEAAGIEYLVTGIWHKINCAPQRQGDRPGQACEALAIGYASRGRKHWARGGEWAYYECPVAIDRGNSGEKWHPTQKPLGLMRALVRDFSARGEAVLDPYVGSGTTGVACIQMGRHFVGCELREDWARRASRRLSGTLEQCELPGVDRSCVPPRRQAKLDLGAAPLAQEQIEE